MSFLERGVLTTEMPVELRSEILEHDDERYLHGLIHALHDVQRYAVNRGQALDLRSVSICLRTAQCLEQALMQFDFRNSDLRRRFDSVKYIVKRLETVAYEVDLAHQRAAAAGQPISVAVPAEGPGANESGVRVLDTARIGQIKTRYDEFDKKRETVIKRSRDVIKSAKNAIYALQRGNFKKADADLGSAAREAGVLYEEIVRTSPALRGGLFSASMEELCEALLLRAFLQDRRLLSHPEVQSSSGLTTLQLSVTEYLGGVLDLTGEVCRIAVRSVSRGREATPEVQACLRCLDAVSTNFELLSVLPGDLDKKMGALRSSLQKVETVLYELSLLSQSMRPEPAEPLPNMEDEL
jgi:predicted translin family RNA/ssDNA-binding protein